MNKYFLFLLASTTLFFSCKKIEGEGGRSSIIGKVYMSDKTGSNQGEYFIPNYRVYIIYGDENDIYNDDMRTNFDGSFEFKHLREGNYRVFAYSQVYSEPSGLKPVFKSVELGKNTTVDVGTIEVEK